MFTLIEGRGKEFTTVTTEVISLQKLAIIDAITRYREEGALKRSILEALSPDELDAYDAGATNEQHIRKRRSGS